MIKPILTLCTVLGVFGFALSTSAQTVGLIKPSHPVQIAAAESPTAQPAAGKAPPQTQPGPSSLASADQPGAAEPQWTAKLAGRPDGPGLFLAVNKKNQELLILEQKSPLAVKEKLTCTTGERAGDKLVEGDLKTPEGVYFVRRRIASGLDYDLYGKLAWTLDYPNPVDRLKGKTGSGIWIHGRGHEIKPYETKGCVALNNDAMTALDVKLAPGLPVVIAGDVAYSPQESGSSPDLAKKVEEWAKAWSSKNDKFFEFYDAEAFSKADEDGWTKFKNTKLNTFRSKDPIDVKALDVRTLYGPDYAVTWFRQRYKGPNLTDEGIKRLYWKADARGVPKIVADQFDKALPDDGKLIEERYEADVKADLLALVEKWRKSWESADLNAYLGFYYQGVAQGDRKGLQAVKEHKAHVWREHKPKRLVLSDLAVKASGGVGVVEFKQTYTAGADFTDKGRKTLKFKKVGGGWLIVEESWKAL